MRTVLAAMLVVATGYAAATEFSGNVAYTTDYRFRGISQGDRSPAIQGGFDIDLGGGLYFGTWASNVGSWSGGTSEMDFYGGYAMELTENTSMDLRVLYYAYPEDDASPGLDYVEIYGSLSVQDLTVGIYFSPEYFAETDTFWYLYGDYSFGLAENLFLDLHLGYNIFDDKESGGAFGIGEVGDPDDTYLDYSVGLATSGMGLDWGLALIGTSLNNSECFGGSKLCDTTVVLSVSKSL